MKNSFLLALFGLLFVSSITVFAQADSCFSPTLRSASGPGNSIAFPCGGGAMNYSAYFSANHFIGTLQYSVSRIPYSFTTFTGTSIPITSDDVWSAAITIPFNFCFFGQSYNRLLIGSNGNLSFDVSTAGGYSGWSISATIPSTSYPRACIFGVFHDIDPSRASSGKRIQYATLGSYPCRTFIVSYENLAYYGSSCGGYVATHQIILHESTNVIDVQITNSPTCPGWNSGRGILGIQDYGRGVAFAAPGYNATAFTARNEGWRFTPSDTTRRTLLAVLYRDGLPIDTTRPYYSPYPVLRADFTTMVTFPPDTHRYFTQLYANPVLPVTGSGTGICSIDPAVSITNTVTVYRSGSLNVTRVVRPPRCNTSNDGTIDLTVSGVTGTARYIWSRSDTVQDLTGVSPGVYRVTVSDGSGCNYIDSFSVTAPPPLAISLDSIRHISCLGASTGGIFITPSGGVGNYTYNWTPASLATQDITGQVAGSYTLTLRDSNNCSTSASYTILPGTLDSSTINRPICTGDSIFLGRAWRSTPGLYKDTLINSRGCDSIVTSNVTLIPLRFFAQSVSICLGRSYTILGSTYRSAGSYYDTTTSSLGCDSIINTVISVINPSPGSRSRSICYDDSIFLQGAWRNTAGAYYDTLIGVSSTGCDSILTTNLILIMPTYGNRNQTICFGDSAFLQGAWRQTPGPYNDTLRASTGCDSILTTTLIVTPWSLGSRNITICYKDSLFLQGAWRNTAGTYYDTLTASTTCDSILTTNLSIASIVNASRNISICYDDRIFLQGAWRNTAGPYYDTLLTVSGCDSALVTNLSIIAPTFGNVDRQLCPGDSLFAGRSWRYGVGTFYDTLVGISRCDSILSTHITMLRRDSVFTSYNVCPGDTVIGFYPSADTNIVTHFNNTDGCDSMYHIFIHVWPNAIANAGPDASIMKGDSIQLTASGGLGFVWSNGSMNASTYVRPLVTTTYYVTVTDDNDCRDDDSVVITVNVPTKAVYMPDAFTPNGDGLNDFFNLINRRDFNVIEFLIWNRWGDIVFNDPIIPDGWDGKFLGNPQLAGTYVYFLRVRDKVNNEESVHQGAVTLIP